MTLRLSKFKDKYGKCLCCKSFKNIQDELLFPKNIKEILIDINILSETDTYNRFFNNMYP